MQHGLAGIRQVCLRAALLVLAAGVKGAEAVSPAPSIDYEKKIRCDRSYLLQLRGGIFVLLLLLQVLCLPGAPPLGSSLGSKQRRMQRSHDACKQRMGWGAESGPAFRGTCQFTRITSVCELRRNPNSVLLLALGCSELEAARKEAAAAKESVSHEMAIMRRQLASAQTALADAEKVPLAASLPPHSSLLPFGLPGLLSAAIWHSRCCPCCVHDLLHA
jgi:hypothetical protein